MARPSHATTLNHLRWLPLRSRSRLPGSPVRRPAGWATGPGTSPAARPGRRAGRAGRPGRASSTRISSKLVEPAQPVGDQHDRTRCGGEHGGQHRVGGGRGRGPRSARRAPARRGGAAARGPAPAAAAGRRRAGRRPRRPRCPSRRAARAPSRGSRRWRRRPPDRRRSRRGGPAAGCRGPVAWKTCASANSPPTRCGSPAPTTCPASGRTVPASTASSVLLPAPLGPTTATRRPGGRQQADVAQRGRGTRPVGDRHLVDARHTVGDRDRRVGRGQRAARPPGTGPCRAGSAGGRRRPTPGPTRRRRWCRRRARRPACPRCRRAAR